METKHLAYASKLDYRSQFPLNTYDTGRHSPALQTQTRLVDTQFRNISPLWGLCLGQGREAVRNGGHAEGGGVRPRRAERQIVLHRRARPLKQPRLLNCNIASFVIAR